MTNDLLPCPFCGGSAHYNFTDAGADRKYYRVHCSKCDARIGHPYTGKDAAATAWNTRTPNKPAEVDLDVLRTALRNADVAIQNGEWLIWCGSYEHAQAILEAARAHLQTLNKGEESA